MISRLIGEVVEIDTASSIVLMVGGVGYQVTLVPHELGLLRIGSDANLHIRMLTKEDGSSLYGFANRADREAFDILRKIQGIGPAAAMALLSSPGRTRLWTAIGDGDLETICLAPGVGRKLAQRIVTELTGRLPEFGEPNTVDVKSSASADLDSEVALALGALGFAKVEIADVLNIVPAGVSVSEAVRICLKALAR